MLRAALGDSLIKECLIAAASGPFFDDAECETLLGASRAELYAIAAAWPKHNDVSDDIARNVITNLLYYPHHVADAEWERYISVSRDKLQIDMSKVK